VRFPDEHWRRIRKNNRLEPILREILRRKRMASTPSLPIILQPIWESQTSQNHCGLVLDRFRMREFRHIAIVCSGEFVRGGSGAVRVDRWLP
jgi:hypothetical protein